MKLSDGVFTVWNTSMLLGVYTWHLGTLWPVLAVMAGWVAPLVHIGDGVKRIQIYQRTLSSISDVIWMSMVDLGLRLCFVVFAMLSICCPRLLCVWTRPSIFSFAFVQCLYGVISIINQSMYHVCQHSARSADTQR